MNNLINRLIDRERERELERGKCIKIRNMNKNRKKVLLGSTTASIISNTIQPIQH